ncbi:hypothetical protein U9M48_024661 [Paspalum notatum var. saurae]|uniref:Uncharacterized protein n=1 Tax=Paspalum notatum var. saurae TaxID=547442 RepID=A0AAQ3TMD7_PASNO
MGHRQQVLWTVLYLRRYTEKVVVPTGQLLPVPDDDHVSSIWQIHGGSSGIGTSAIQIAKYLGIKEMKKN